MTNDAAIITQNRTALAANGATASRSAEMTTEYNGSDEPEAHPQLPHRGIVVSMTGNLMNLKFILSFCTVLTSPLFATSG